jgi:hypothetical protein
MDNMKTMWAGFCLPAQIFPVVMAGIVVFNIWVGLYNHAAKNTLYALAGTAALSLLCGSGMEMLAYVLLALPVIFFLFLLALIILDQSTLVDITHECTGCDQCNGSNQASCTSMCKGCN